MEKLIMSLMLATGVVIMLILLHILLKFKAVHGEDKNNHISAMVIITYIIIPVLSVFAGLFLGQFLTNLS